MNKLALVFRDVYKDGVLGCDEQMEGKPRSNLMAPLPIYIPLRRRSSKSRRPRGAEGKRGREITGKVEISIRSTRSQFHHSARIA